MKNEQKPLIAITMGDPAGIGPEVTVKALENQIMYQKCRPFVIGNTSAVQNVLEICASNLSSKLCNSLKEVSGSYGTIDVLDIKNLNFGDVEIGQLSADAGRASVEWVLKAGELAKNGDITAVVTAPINKSSAKLAGYDDIGHMEIFQSQTGAKNVATMLMARQLRVVHLTTHKSLRVACDYVTFDNVLSKILLTCEHFKKWGFPSPRVAVASLNPHGSDGGLLGDEEDKQITPAVEAARDLGWNVTGPIPPDTVFNQAIDGKFDVVVAMYHDQGHIAIKVHDWAKSVSVNLGLPFIRTSVDHGTAFDISGKGIADHTSMLEAMEVAVDLSKDSKLR